MRHIGLSAGRSRRKAARTCGRCVSLLVMLVVILCAAGYSRQATLPGTILDAGDFKLRYVPRKSAKKGGKGRGVGGNPQAIARVVAELNGKVALPYDLDISFEDCPDPDAFYDPETRRVTVCYQLIDEYYELFSRRVKDTAKLEQAVRGATVATFFHELGHALVDAWELPITGREEDAVDQLSTLVLLGRSEEGVRMALDGARSFSLYAALTRGQPRPYWDEHSFDEQRFYDTVCLIYGHDPKKYEYLIKDGTLPSERAEMCEEEYDRINKSWRSSWLLT